jgi:Flp pilus assembly protein TadD
VEAYKIVLQINPRDAETFYNLAVAQSRLRSFADAIGNFRQALRYGIDSPDLHSNLGIALAEIGQPAEAAEHFQEALRQDPQSEGARSNYAVLLRSLGRLDEAQQLESATLGVQKTATRPHR